MKHSRCKKKKFSQSPLWVRVLLILVICILVLILAIEGFLYSKISKIEKIEVKKEVIEESVSEEVEHKTGYMNVAVFGLDSRDGSLGKGNRSDTMMIVSLNHETYEVKMVSIYRDTLLKLNDGSYNKANSAYAFYGPEGALALINQNLDMNIDKYVSVNFNALVDVIDAVGGMELDLTAEEVVHMNNYCVETSKVTEKDYQRIEPEVAGTYHLNGVQAVSYSRIRYTAGGDAQRTVRQRLVISKILEKIKGINLTTLNEIVDNVFPQVATNFTMAEILTYAKDFQKYTLGESMGFPSSRTSEKLYGVGWTEVANTLTSNVMEVHRYLFGNSEYQVSSTVQEIDNVIWNRINSGFYDEPEPEPEETPEATPNETPNETLNETPNETPGETPSDSTDTDGISDENTSPEQNPDIEEEEYYDEEE